MSKSLQNRGLGLGEILAKDESALIEDWLKEMSGSTRRGDLIKESDLRSQSSLFLKFLRQGAESQNSDIETSSWEPMRDLMGEISRTRAQQGFTPTETATFILSFKKPLFTRLRSQFGGDANALANELWSATELLDSLGLYTVETYIKTREELIRRQQEEMLELSTPVVKLWDGILALPIIGTLDSARTQVVMETLLENIVKTNSKVAIIDITGVPTVDTVVAQHLLKTVTAARLMGADCIISGVRPQIAQTIVHLGINLLDVTTKATLSDAFNLALQRTGLSLGKVPSKSHRNNPWKRYRFFEWGIFSWSPFKLICTTAWQWPCKTTSRGESARRMRVEFSSISPRSRSWTLLSAVCSAISRPCRECSMLRLSSSGCNRPLPSRS
jgi:Anti-anti-sigma regulatory factor (antagonist of anti-sigma factor)